MLAAVYFFKYYTGLSTLATTVGTLQFKILYGLLLFSSFLLALFKHKETKAKLAFKNASLLTTHAETTNELLTSYKDQAQFVKTFQASGASELAKIIELSKKNHQKYPRLTTIESTYERHYAATSTINPHCPAPG